MGQVWQATDTQLKREVALKILPDAFAADPDRLARFKREAQILASLNHPNIAAIYGIEEAPSTSAPSTDGDAERSQGSGQAVRALVLELVEGPTLADRISNGPIPLDEALPIAKQIAEALEAAHEAGVIHRDLKPANIKVRDDGTVKVLDFGLAKALGPSPTGDPSESPTLTAMATQMGVIMGTAAYMSPEQARGKPVDKRADIWAFGCVVYEMLTGSKPFPGDDISQTLARVIDRDPDWETLPRALPQALDTCLRRCLQKDPRQRVRDIGDARLAMEGGFETTASAPSEPVAVPQLQVWQRPIPATVAMLAAVVTGGLAVWTMTRPEVVPTGLVRFSIVPPDTAPMNLVGPDRDLAVSPDGNQVVYKGLNSTGTAPQLNLRPIDQLAGEPLRGAELAVGPFFSPDGQWVGFQGATYRTLYKVSILGGLPVRIATTPRIITGHSWGADGQIVFGMVDGGLFRVSDGGGEPEVLTTPDSAEGERDHRWPYIIPGRDAVVFTINADDTPLISGQLAVLDLDSGDVTRLGLAGVSPQYVSTGHLVYAAADGSVRGVPFDVASLRVTGNPVPLIEGVEVQISGSANFDISNNGRLVYVPGEGGGSQRSLVWVDREGREEPLATPVNAYSTVSLSPDETRAAVGLAGDTGGADVWIADLARGTLSRLTTDETFDCQPLWSPDGDHVIFTSTRNGRPELFWQPADGSASAEPVLAMDESVTRIVAGDWSPDGETLFLHAVFAETGGDIGMVSISESSTWEPLIQTGAFEMSPALSPDGRWLAYSSNETGRREVYAVRFPELEGRQQISVGGGFAPWWSDDGRELLFLGASAGPPEWAMLVSIEVGPGDPPSLLVGTPEQLFDFPYFIQSGGRRHHDVSADGQRQLVIARGQVGEDAPPPQINVVLNWFEELKARVPLP